MAAESVYSGATGTDRTASMNSTTWKSGASFGGKKKLKKSVHSGGTNSGSTNTSATGNQKVTRNIQVGRYVLVFVLLVSAALLGYFSYYLMDSAESRLAKNRFISIVQRAEANAKWVVEQKKQASDALANMYGTANPDASEWPFVHMEGYKEIASKLKLITKGSLSFCPIVIGFGEDSEQVAFEEYWYNLYDKWGYPEGTGESVFGKGIYGFGYDVINNKLWPDYRYPVLSNITAHALPNPNNIMVPFVQSDFGNHSALMLDVQFEYNRFMTTQNVMDCSEERKTAQDKDIDCGSITDMIWQRTNAQDVSAGPTGILYSPIYPRNDPFEVKGFILHKQVWHDLLKHAFESDISGIRIVLHTDTGREHSYDVRDGEVTYVGNRTHHCVAFSDGDFVECSPDDEWVPFDDLYYLDDEKSDDFRALKIPITEGIFSDETVNYYMDIYATEEFVSQFDYLMGDSEFPFSIVVCLGTVFVMLFTSLLFVAYDYYVRKEFNAKNQLLEAKRRFVRFVSHEVRTPLNTVCMGLTLLENDLAGALDGSELTKALKDSVNTSKMDSRVDNDELVLKKENVEDWLSLSTQVFHNADAAVGVLSDLLNYDKIQMGALTLELSLINLWATLEKTVEEFKMAATEKTVELSIDFSPLMKPGLFSADNSSTAKTDLLVQKGGIEESAKSQSMKASDLPADIQKCLVVGDKIRLTQVFRNLISNALKFSKPHTQMAVRISVDPLEEKKQNQEKISLHKNVLAECLNIGTVSVEVIDQGVGMTQEQVDTVFEDGTQFDANKLQGGGGSGLGLNIARGIVLEHGGTLTCSSEGIGKGTTFTLSTKLYKDLNASNQAEAEAHDDEENAGDANFTVPLLHVLVVDDSLTNRKLCQRLLERNGHRTEGASNGKEAVEMVKKSMETGRYYDSILMDYEMPEMNGPDACRLIRKLGCSSYIAGVTGNVMSEDVDHFRSCGANWVIAKPFSVNAMEDQWVEDGVTPFNETEESMVRVESSQGIIDLGGKLD